MRAAARRDGRRTEPKAAKIASSLKPRNVEVRSALLGRRSSSSTQWTLSVRVTLRGERVERRRLDSRPVAGDRQQIVVEMVGCTQAAERRLVCCFVWLLRCSPLVIGIFLLAARLHIRAIFVAPFVFKRNEAVANAAVASFELRARRAGRRRQHSMRAAAR